MAHKLNAMDVTLSVREHIRMHENLNNFQIILHHLGYY